MTNDHNYDSPWPALWAMVVGFFMILVDSTIVSVATDSIMTGLHTDLGSVIWVTSAYLLAYVVPLLLTGRLGDRFGPRTIYLYGLTVFTLASVACGLAGSIELLVIARVVQGLGAAMMSPQTMAVITRTFPPDKRGIAMSIWGSVAGIAMLVGPLAGGLIVGTLGWEWIFFLNLPVGLIAFTLTFKFVPRLPTHPHRFDFGGIALSGLGLFLVVFGLQEGEHYDWGTIAGPISVWSMILAGVVLLVAFVLWQARAAEPLMSLRLFRERNFSLANIGILTMGFSVIGQAIPLMLFGQKSMGLSPLESGLLLTPLALLSGVLAAPVGRLTDKGNPRNLAVFGFAISAVATFWLGSTAAASSSMLEIWAPIGLLGIGNAFVWAPLASAATRKLPPDMAGAGSGVYNMTRQLGGVLGAAAVGVLMQVQVDSRLGSSGGPDIDVLQQSTGPLSEPMRQPFAEAMGSSLYLPAALLLIGCVAVACLKPPVREKTPATHS